MENLNTSTQNNTSIPSMPQIPRMLPLKQVIHYTGLSSTTIYDMLDKKSNRYDSTFPIQVKLSKGRVGWVENEIAEWLNNKIRARAH
jgi:prophage regulatory protein